MKAKKKYEELWNKIRDLIRSITKNLNDYDEKYMKIKFDSDDNLPLNKTTEIPIMTMVVRTVFHENDKYYPQNIKMLYYDKINFSERIDANKTSASKGCNVCHYCNFLNYSFKFQPNVCSRCFDLLVMSINLSNIAILNIQDSE